MNNTYYSSERSILLLISLLKQYNIKKIVVSPGATNITFVASIQQDPFFEIYSCVDERSAAYIACGLSAETQEPVALSCTGATAARNYLSGLTEAYYRKLPIIAITSTQDINKVGHLVPQVTDRSVIPNDIALCSVYIPLTIDDQSEWSNTIKINKALSEISRHGGGPVHINIATSYSKNFSIQKLPEARIIRRICPNDKYPDLPNGRIAIFIGSHAKFNTDEIKAIDTFCHNNNAVVMCDHTSGYNGKYKVLINILTSQDNYICDLVQIDLLIHIGEISGSYIGLSPKSVWRVNPDGEMRDYYKKLEYIFEMEESIFFHFYLHNINDTSDSYLRLCQEKLQNSRNKIPDNIPFSNIWIAQQTSYRLPHKSTLHLAILNTLRAWNFFEIPNDISVYSNTGGFGIDGCISSLIGASFANPEKLYFGIVGDLAFFYDMNVLGNRHIGNNIRLLLVNNGKGTEFRNYKHDGAMFGNDTDKYIAAGGHFGNKSPKLVKHYADDLNFEYLTAKNKEEYLKNIEYFVNPSPYKRSIIFEVFTTSEDESDALKIMNNLELDKRFILKKKIKSAIGEKGVEIIKNIVK